MAERFPRAFVCGHPIAHSRSPVVHRYWLAENDIAGSYEAVDVEPRNFAGFLASLGAHGWAGGNVTVPHKEAAFALCQSRDSAAETIGAVNTVWIENGRLAGANTDALGFERNLDDFAPRWDDAACAVVLGAGGAARAVVHALKERGLTDIRVVNRTLSRAKELSRHFGAPVTGHGWKALPELLQGAGLLANTTSLGMDGQSSQPIDLSGLQENAVVTDIVYVPLETPLLAAARQCGLTAVDGLGMLLHQAVPGFERWFGIRPRVTAALRSHVLNTLENGR